MNKKKKVLIVGCALLFSGLVISSSIGLAYSLQRQKQIKKQQDQLESKNIEIVNLRSEIEALQTKVDVLKEENMRLKSQVNSLQEVINITNAANDGNNQITKLLSSLVEDSKDTQENSKTIQYLQKHLETISKQRIEKMKILRDKIHSIAELKLVDQDITNYLNNVQKQIDNYIKNIQDLKIISKEKYKEQIQKLDTINARFIEMNLQLIEYLNQSIGSKNQHIDHINNNLLNTQTKLKESITKSILVVEQNIETLQSLIGYIDGIDKLGFSVLNLDEWNKKFNNDFKELRNQISKYIEFLKTQKKNAQTSLKKAIEQQNYQEIVILDKDLFAAKIRFYVEQTNIFNNKSHQLLLNLNKNLLDRIAQKEEQIAKLNNKNIELSDQLKTALQEKTIALANLKKLKEDLNSSFKNSINSIILSLRGISTTIKSSDHQNKDDLATRLDAEILKLENLLNDYVGEEFIRKYEPFVESAMKTANQVIEDYKNQILDPLKREFSEIQKDLEKAKQDLIVIQNELDASKNQYHIINKELEASKKVVNEKENKLLDISKQLVEKQLSLDIINGQKISNQREISNFIDEFIVKYNKLKLTAEELINQAIENNINTSTLNRLLKKSFAIKNENDFSQMSSLINEYIKQYQLIVDESFDLYQKIIRSTINKNNSEKASKNSIIESLNADIANLRLEKSAFEAIKQKLIDEIKKMTLLKEQYEKEIDLIKTKLGGDLNILLDNKWNLEKNGPYTERERALLKSEYEGKKDIKIFSKTSREKKWINRNSFVVYIYNQKESKLEKHILDFDKQTNSYKFEYEGLSSLLNATFTKVELPTGIYDFMSPQWDDRGSILTTGSKIKDAKTTIIIEYKDNTLSIHESIEGKIVPDHNHIISKTYPNQNDSERHPYYFNGAIVGPQAWIVNIYDFDPDKKEEEK